jgi:hypothetical protein
MVLFRQVYKNLPVLFSDVMVRMNSNGRVSMIGSEFYPDCSVDTNPQLDAADARTAALAGLKINTDNGVTFEDHGLCVLPYRTLDGIKYRLAWELQIGIDDLHIWNTWVDAETGEIIWRWNQVRDGSDGNVTGSVSVSSVNDPATTVLYRDMTVKVNGASSTTDAAGHYTSSNSGAVTASLSGTYCKVSRQNGSNASYSGTVAGGGTAVIQWTNTNSQPEERAAYYHVVRAHAYLKNLDAGVTGMDYQVVAKVDVNGYCNAFWDGTNLNFYKGGTTTSGTCPNMALLPDVIFHEYGHGVNDKLYKQLGNTSGMINTALHEGLADGFSAMILDRPEMGVGFWGTGTTLRNNNNTKKYPDDIVGEEHADGEIMAGAIWEMRKSLPLSVVEHDVHYAKRGLPDDANTGKAYVKYFLEVLEADDNDANLSNGTPHSAQIVPAFALHGIPAGVLAVTHTPVTSSNGGTPIALSVSITSPMTELGVSGVRIYYRVLNGSWTYAVMSRTSGDIHATSAWSGSIPAQPNGTIIEYYLQITESYGGTTTYPTKGASDAYKVLIGFSSLTLYDFETSQGWSRDPGDDAMTGKWINAVPVASYVGTSLVQPDADHTASGVKCWVTANASSAAEDAGTADVDDGTTTLYSPTFSLIGISQPVIRYYSWYSNDLGASPNTDVWQVQISNDDGNSWYDIENTTVSYREWTAHIILVSSVVTQSSSMKLRFIASDVDPQSLVEAAVDDVEILYCQPTPVELQALSARRNNDDIDVMWTTASEQNNAGFEVEYRTAGGNEWTRAGYVNGHGTTQLSNNYTFNFACASESTVQVRLVQLDLDGTRTPSHVVEVAGQEVCFRLDQNYPNPASGRTAVSFVLDMDGPAAITVYNVLGMAVLHKELTNLRAGSHVVDLDMSGMPAGVYQYRLVAGSRTLAKSMTVR